MGVSHKIPDMEHQLHNSQVETYKKGPETYKHLKNGVQTCPRTQFFQFVCVCLGAFFICLKLNFVKLVFRIWYCVWFRVNILLILSCISFLCFCMFFYIWISSWIWGVLWVSVGHGCREEPYCKPWCKIACGAQNHIQLNGNLSRQCTFLTAITFMSLDVRGLQEVVSKGIYVRFLTVPPRVIVSA